MLLLNPLLKTSADLFIKQLHYEKTQGLISEADRAFELMGRAIRMAAFRNTQSTLKSKSRQIAKASNFASATKNQYLEIQKGAGYRKSDALVIRHELSDGIDFDCIGNVLTQERTKNDLAYQGFIVNRQAAMPKGSKGNGGSLICQSLDRQGRIQNTTLMNGVDGLLVEELNPYADKALGDQRVFKITLLMTDGARLNLALERTFVTRNFL